jgi:alanyl-tRNA synthetase
MNNPKYIIADHIKAVSFIISEGVMPSGKGRGYVLRRLIRRSLSASLSLKIDINNKSYFEDLVDAVINIYDGVYDELKATRNNVVNIVMQESVKYQKAIGVGYKEWNKILN